MRELTRDEFGSVRSIAAPMSQLHASVAAVIEGAAPGRVWVCGNLEPRFAVIEGPEGTYLVGSVQDDPEVEAVAELLDDWVYLHVDPASGDVPRRALPNAYMLAHPRLLFMLQPADLDASLPAALTTRPEADGVGLRAFRDNVEVAWCTVDVAVGSRAELGIWVDVSYRRAGVATFLVKTVLDAARARGLMDIGWHCHASNTGSIALARKFSSSEPTKTLAYCASLPAENDGDLDSDTCRILARHFEAGEAEIAWLAFHAAGAWAQAGEPDAALDVIDRLVQGQWQGQPEWLDGHWALSRLKVEPRFRDALARLKIQKAPPG